MSSRTQSTRTGSVFVEDGAAAAAAAAVSAAARGRKRGLDEISEGKTASNSSLSIQIGFDERASKRGKNESE